MFERTKCTVATLCICSSWPLFLFLVLLLRFFYYMFTHVMLMCNAFCFVSVSLDIAKIFMQWCNLHSHNKHRRNCLQSLFVASSAVTEIKTRKGKGKAIPLEAWTGPEGSRRLRLPDFKTIVT